MFILIITLMSLTILSSVFTRSSTHVWSTINYTMMEALHLIIFPSTAFMLHIWLQQLTSFEIIMAVMQPVSTRAFTFLSPPELSPCNERRSNITWLTSAVANYPSLTVSLATIASYIISLDTSGINNIRLGLFVVLNMMQLQKPLDCPCFFFFWFMPYTRFLVLLY